MTEKRLLDFAYRYYPRNIDSIVNRENYLKTFEYISLIEKIQENKLSYKSTVSEWIQNFQMICTDNIILNDATYFEWLDRCYTFEFLENHTVLKVFKSILTPIYCLKYYLVNIVGDKYKYLEISESKFPNQNLVTSLKIEMDNQKYTEMDSSLITKKIEDINFDDIPMGEFTFFNAFCNSQSF